jgi:hypothetical protein
LIGFVKNIVGFTGMISVESFMNEHVKTNFTRPALWDKASLHKTPQALDRLCERRVVKAQRNSPLEALPNY